MPLRAGELEDLFRKGADAYRQGDYAVAVGVFERLVDTADPGPALDSVHFYLALCRLRAGNRGGAIDAFETYLRLYPAGMRLAEARAGLVEALLGEKRIPEALRMLALLDADSAGLRGADDAAVVTMLSVEAADRLIEDRKPADAWALLSVLPDRNALRSRQRGRVVELEQLLRQARAAGATPSDPERSLRQETLAERLETAKAALRRLEETVDFDLPRLLRQGRALLESGEPWEAIVLYDETLGRFPRSAHAPYVLHGLILARQAAGRPGVALDLCRRFLADYPDQALSPEIASLAGRLALDLKQPKEAEAFFGSAIDRSSGTLRAQMIAQLGHARFARGEWAAAREAFERFAREFPADAWVEGALYRAALTWYLDTGDVDRYRKAEKALKDFIVRFPRSEHVPDAGYRLAVCLFAFQEPGKAIGACEEWERRNPTHALLGEVLSLKADVLRETGASATALDEYLRASSAASSDEVLDYALTQAARLLEASRDWARLSSLFRTQLERAPDSPLSLGWAYWFARAEARAGRPDEAWDFLAGRVRLSLADETREDVEKILLLMAQIRTRKRGAEAAHAEPDAELSARLGVEEEAPALAKARISLYEAYSLRLTRKAADADRTLLRVGRELAPGELSAPLLAESGEVLAKAGEAERAALFFNELIARFPASSYRDFAYVGLGDIALERGEPAAALKHYDDAIDLAGAEHRLREATLGRALASFDLGRLDEAEKLFAQVAATKEWRGEATAQSLHYLGLVAVRRGDLPKGIAFFQRVFVSQGRHPRWVAASYLESARAFEQLGKAGEAAATYREMLRHERLQDRPELSTARERLAALPSP